MQLLSPKQVAKSIGVSESSLKRWCDQGHIKTVKTPGGHRRMRVGDVVSFLRETKRPLLHADLLGLPAGVGRNVADQSSAKSRVMEALQQGQEQVCRRLLIDRYIAGETVVAICEDYITPAMHKLGDRWQCGEAEIYQERLACGIVGKTMHDLQSVLPSPDAEAPLAIGGSPSGDHYRLPSMMIEAVLMERGWKAVSLGDNLPYATILSAAQQQSPRLLWISISREENPDNWLPDLHHFAAKLSDEVSLIVGGRAMSDLDSEQAGELRLGRSFSQLQAYADEVRSEEPRADDDPQG